MKATNITIGEINTEEEYHEEKQHIFFVIKHYMFWMLLTATIPIYFYEPTCAGMA